MNAHTLGCRSSDRKGRRSLVLNTTWIRLLEYECDIVPSLRDSVSGSDRPQR